MQLFAPAQSAQAEPLLEYAEFALASLTDKLGDLARANWLGPLVILLFADVESYDELPLADVYDGVEFAPEEDEADAQ